MPMLASDLQAPNRICFLEDADAWREIAVTHPTILIPVTGAPVVHYSPSRRHGDVVTNAEYFRDRRGLVYFPTPGTWYCRFPLAGSVAADVCFIALDCASPESAQILWHMLLSSAGSAVDVVRWAGAALAAGRNADADADFAAADVGGLVNSRSAFYSREATDFVRGEAADLAYYNASSHGTANALITLASLLGRDSGDSTVRALEARNADAVADAAAALYGLVTNSRGYFRDAGAGNWEFLRGDFANAISGRATPSAAGPHVAAILTKEDQTNAVLRTVETDRFVRTVTTNPTALQVVGTSDARGLVHGGMHVLFSAGDTARVQVSVNNSDWETMEDVVMVGGTAQFLPTTELLLHRLKAWRYRRVLAVAGFTGTSTVTIPSQGA